jgi:hypothetical protein
MTESEWTACADPWRMLESLPVKASARKLRLFACACVRQVWHLLADGRSRTAVDVAERHVDALAGQGRLPAAWGAAQAAVPHGRPSQRKPEYDAARAAVWVAVPNNEQWFVERATREAVRSTSMAARDEGRRDGSERQCSVLRCLFRPPPAPALGNPGGLACGAGTLRPLAQAAYDEHHLPYGHLDPTRLAVLADALEEAGCTDADLLGHLRGPSSHWRGCWAVDLILGKQ